MTLLKKAQAIKLQHRPGRKLSSEEIEVALAWLEGKVSSTQVAKAMGLHPGTVQSRLSRMLRGAYDAGKLKVVERR